MVALTEDRKAPRRAGNQFNDPVGAGETIYGGGIVVLNGTGYAAPGTTATGLTARGVAREQVDNSGGADGDKTVESERGVFRLANSSGDPIDRTHIGGTGYIEDDQTVAASDGGATRSEAGEIVDVDDDGVWVDFG